MNKIVAIDFDGTCVTHLYSAENPEVVGLPIGSVEYLRKLSKHGVKIILYTMRSGDHLTAAVNWFESHQINLWGVNVNPEQHTWSKSPKVYAQLYVDDAALGCPLMKDQISDRPFVNWKIVGPRLMKWAGIKKERVKKSVK